MNKTLIRENFSRCARYYDLYSTVQNLCALRLIDKIESRGFTNILDIGCGTGNFTTLLKERFPCAEIKAVDISPAMIKLSRNKIQEKRVRFIVADGEKIELNEKFDLIASNASLQWFENLGKTLSRYRKLLAGNGVILFSLFGPRTFYELRESLEELMGKDTGFTSSGFLDKSRIEEIMRREFGVLKVEGRTYYEKYSSLKELLEKIKYTGSRGNGAAARQVWSPKMIKELEEIYIRKFKDIRATYEAIFCEGA